jgi:predicted membrane-bound spermidine synthase
MSNSKNKNNSLSYIMMLLAAFIVGAVIMSLEMLASRYLNPYFGGTIFTWAALISVVLLAMMGGYFLGGYSADKKKSGWLLEVMIFISALYMIALPQFIDPMMEIVITTIEDVKLGALVGAFVVTGLPVACLSTYSPVAIRRTLSNVEHAGRTSGTIFAISTAGNIFGTLVTSFYLIPNFGTRSLTMSLSVFLIIAMVIVIFARPKSESKKAATQFNTVLPILLILVGLMSLSFLGANELHAKEGSRTVIEKQAAYPEGPVFIGGDLYYTEMTRNRVMKVPAQTLEKMTLNKKSLKKKAQ